jgi:hypothetical protein
MERVLALHTLSIRSTPFNDEALGSDDSNICSTESGQRCSAQSIACQVTDQGTVNFW